MWSKYIRAENLVNIHQVKAFSHDFKKSKSNLHTIKEKVDKYVRKLNHAVFLPSPNVIFPIWLKVKLLSLLKQVVPLSINSMKQKARPMELYVRCWLFERLRSLLLKVIVMLF